MSHSKPVAKLRILQFGGLRGLNVVDWELNGFACTDIENNGIKRCA